MQPPQWLLYKMCFMSALQASSCSHLLLRNEGGVSLAVSCAIVQRCVIIAAWSFVFIVIPCVRPCALTMSLFPLAVTFILRNGRC